MMFPQNEAIHAEWRGKAACRPPFCACDSMLHESWNLDIINNTIGKSRWGSMGVHWAPGESASGQSPLVPPFHQHEA